MRVGGRSNSEILKQFTLRELRNKREFRRNLPMHLRRAYMSVSPSFGDLRLLKGEPTKTVVALWVGSPGEIGKLHKPGKDPGSFQHSILLILWWDLCPRSPRWRKDRKGHTTPPSPCQDRKATSPKLPITLLLACWPGKYHHLAGQCYAQP